MKMDFQRSRNLVKGLLFAAIALCLIALFTDSKVPQLSPVLIAVAIGCIVVAFLFIFTLLKCPYCGHRIVRNVLKVKACPHCSRNLITGIKVGKKGLK